MTLNGQDFHVILVRAADDEISHRALMAVLPSSNLMGLTLLIEFSLQLFDHVNVARREKPIFLYVSCFQICVGLLLNRSAVFFLWRHYNYTCPFLLIKTNILLGTLPRVLKFSSDKNPAWIFLA